MKFIQQAFLISLLTIIGFYAQAQKPVKIIPMKVSNADYIKTWEVHNKENKEIIWLWYSNTQYGQRLTVKKLNYQFEVEKEFSAPVNFQEHTQLRASAYDKEKNAYRLIFSNTLHGILVVYVSIENQDIQYKIHPFEKGEHFAGYLTHESKLFYFTLSKKPKNKFTIYEYQPTVGLTAHPFIIKEIPNLLLKHNGMFKKELGISLISPEGMKSLVMPNPMRKLYYEDGQFYFTFNPKVGVGRPNITYFMTFDLKNNSYKLKQLIPPYLPADQDIDANSFIYQDKLFMVTSQPEHLKLTIYDMKNDFALLKEHSYSKGKDFPFTNGSIIKTTFNVATGNFYTFEPNQKTNFLLQKMANVRSMITVAKDTDDRLILTIGSYNYVESTDSHSAYITPKIRSTFFQTYLDAHTLEILPKEISSINSKLNFQSPITKGTFNRMAFRKKVKEGEEAQPNLNVGMKIRRHINSMTYGKLHFRILLDLTVVIDNKVYYGHYIKKKKEFHVYLL